MIRYQLSSADVPEILAEILAAHHPGLAEARIAVVMARGVGSPTKAEARVMPALARAAGSPDLIVTIDADAWGAGASAERRAALDHALASVEPGKGSDGAGRPRLKRRRPDLVGIGFRDVWERNGAAAIEAGRARALRDAAGQLLMFPEGDGR